MRPGKYHVRLLRVAESYLADIISFVAADNFVAAEDLLTRIETNLDHLEKHPFLGRSPDDEKLVRLGYRYLIVSDYLIFYTVRGKTVLVHLMIHGARNYKDLL